MEGENGTSHITLNGNHAGRKHESPGVPQPIQEVSYRSQGRTRDRMAIGVIPLTKNGPSHLIYCARGWTERQRRLHRDCGVEARGSGKSLESRQAGSLRRLIDLCDFWHVAKRRSHQAIQRIYISVHQQKSEIKDFIKHLRNT